MSKHEELIFHLFILNYFGFSQIDEYLYSHFHKKNYKLAQAMFDAFPENECYSVLFDMTEIKD